jgi:hypothetical protein
MYLSLVSLDRVIPFTSRFREHAIFTWQLKDFRCHGFAGSTHYKDEKGIGQVNRL